MTDQDPPEEEPIPEQEGSSPDESATSTSRDRSRHWSEGIFDMGPVLWESLQRAGSSAVISAGLIDAFKDLDLAKTPLAGVVGAMVSDALFGSTSVSSVVAATLADARLSELAALAIGEDLSAWYAELTRVADSISSTSLVLARAYPTWEVEQAANWATKAWEITARNAPAQPNVAEALHLASAGQSTTGVLEAGLTLTGKQAESPQMTEGLLSPGTMARRLRDRLAELDSSLPNRLDGAWERVSHAGPDALSQAAHSLQEAIDWTLRAAAPDAVVLEWHVQARRPATELSRGRPTRRLRAEYILRERAHDRKAVDMWLKALGELVSVIEEMKHGNSDRGLDAVIRLIPTVEGLLAFLLL